MLHEYPIFYYLIIAAPGGCCCNRIFNHYLHLIHVSFFSVCPSLNVKLSHDATCVPSTCSDNDGHHPERSSTIVPGEPTGQRLHKNVTRALNEPAHTTLKAVKTCSNLPISFFYKNTNSEFYIWVISALPTGLE